MNPCRRTRRKAYKQEVAAHASTGGSGLRACGRWALLWLAYSAVVATNSVPGRRRARKKGSGAVSPVDMPAPRVDDDSSVNDH